MAATVSSLRRPLHPKRNEKARWVLTSQAVLMSILSIVTFAKGPYLYLYDVHIEGEGVY